MKPVIKLWLTSVQRTAKCPKLKGTAVGKCEALMSESQKQLKQQQVE